MPRYELDRALGGYRAVIDGVTVWTGTEPSVVKALACHEAMLEALRTAKQWLDTEAGGMTARAYTYRTIDAAIAKAEGK